MLKAILEADEASTRISLLGLEYPAARAVAGHAQALSTGMGIRCWLASRSRGQACQELVL